MDADIIIEIQKIFEDLNSKQKQIANRIILEYPNNFKKENNIIYIGIENTTYKFIEFVKSKCGCE